MTEPANELEKVQRRLQELQAEVQALEAQIEAADAADAAQAPRKKKESKILKGAEVTGRHALPPTPTPKQAP